MTVAITRRLAALVAALLTLAAAPPALAADWRDGGPITDPDEQANPLEVAVDATGQAALAWSGYTSGDPRPLLRRRPFGGSLGNPRALFQTAASVFPLAAGNETMTVLQQPLATPRQVLVQSFPADGTLQSTVIADAGGDGRICAVAGALAPNGVAVIVYGTRPGGDIPPPGARCDLFARVRTAPAEPFGDPVALASAPELVGVDVALDAEGRGFVTWLDAAAPSLRAARFDPAAGFAAEQSLDVPGERPDRITPPLLRVGANGRALVAFPSRPAAGGSAHVAAATGDTATGFGATQVLSGPAILTANYGRDFDAAAAADGTLGVTWRAGRDARARIQGALAGAGQPLTSARTEALSAYGARGARVTAGQGRVSVAWFRLVPGVGRAIEMTYGRPASGFGRARRISGAPVAVVPPHLATSARGASWITWGDRPVGSRQDLFAAWKARKLTLSTNALSRELDVLRARTNFRGERLTPSFTLVPTIGDGMLAGVLRARTDSAFWQLRTYGE
jgi:hypothetical protein